MTIEKINEKWDFVIGLEIHVQLDTNSKMFSDCNYIYDVEPNTLTCPTSLGLPGALPTVNLKAIEFAYKFGKAVNGNINSSFNFARKHYFYPDLPKGYQISQFDKPIVEGGHIPIWWNEKNYDIALTRAHLEEDAGKSSHNSKNKNSLIDFNRSGAPLIEIVTEPVMTHPEQAKKFVQRVKQLVDYIGISKAEMEKGKLRCDANISLKQKNSKKFGTKTEIKNINSFKNVQRAIESEIIRQSQKLENNEIIEQATLTWNNEKNLAEIMRIKENADDYRYFPDPDLPPIDLDKKFLEKIESAFEILPFEYEKKWTENYNLSLNDSIALASTREIAEYFEELISKNIHPNKACSWILNELFRLFNENEIIFSSEKVSTEDLKRLIVDIEKETITQSSGKEILRKIFERNISYDEILRNDDYSTKDLNVDSIIKKTLSSFPEEIKRFKSGEKKLLGFFIGQVNKKTNGKLNHKIIAKSISDFLKD